MSYVLSVSIKPRRTEKNTTETENSYTSARQQQTAHPCPGVLLHKGPMEAEQIGEFTKRTSPSCAVPQGTGPYLF